MLYTKHRIKINVQALTLPPAQKKKALREASLKKMSFSIDDDEE